MANTVSHSPLTLSPLKTALETLWAFLKKDGRHFQILFLGSFLTAGIALLDWDILPSHVLTIVGTCILVQAVFVLITGAPWSSVKSALISSLGLSILIKTNALETAAIAAAITIASKFIIQVDRKHIFNPVNIGIVLTSYFTGDAWVSPGQWGSHIAILFMVGAAGMMVVLKVGRIDLSLGFIGTFWLLEFIRTYFYLGWPADHFFHFATNGTILLFTFFMITDPVTTPNHPLARYLFAAVVGVLAFIFTHTLYMNSGAPIWALFLVSPTTVFFDRLFKGDRFQWIQKPA